jgi:hypothetical protein
MVYCFSTDYVKIGEVKDRLHNDLLMYIFGENNEVSFLEYTNKIIEYYELDKEIQDDGISVVEK